MNPFTQLIKLSGFVQKAVGAAFTTLILHLQFPIVGKDKHNALRRRLLDPAQHFQTAEVPELQIENHNTRTKGFENEPRSRRAVRFDELPDTPVLFEKLRR